MSGRHPDFHHELESIMYKRTNFRYGVKTREDGTSQVYARTHWCDWFYVFEDGGFAMPDKEEHESIVPVTAKDARKVDPDCYENALVCHGAL